MGLTDWKQIGLTFQDLSLKTTLFCGQSFRWRETGPDEWSIGFRGRVLSLKQDVHFLYYRDTFPEKDVQESITPVADSGIDAGKERNEERSSMSKDPATSTSKEDSTLHILNDYLNLSPNIPSLYSKWADGDPNFRKKALDFPGIRMLRQDPWETLIGFICSSNNNISRISQMMDKLCIHYGPYLATIHDKPFHDFPTPDALAASGVRENLQKLGFGYRAKYIHETAKMVANDKGIDWLYGLANSDHRLTSLDDGLGELPEGGRAGYQAAHEELLQLQGVGPKVADCICLMALGWSESVPIDTHVWQIAIRDYKMKKSANSSLTKRQYQSVAEHFRTLWGSEAGWAHSILFTADLKSIGTGVSKKGLTKDSKNSPVHVNSKELDDGEHGKDAVPSPSTTVKRKLKTANITAPEPPVARRVRPRRKVRGDL